MTDEEYGDWVEVDNGYALTNEDAVRELLQQEQARDQIGRASCRERV